MPSSGPTSFHAYTVFGEIARGGQGVVLQARHPSGAPVALKLLTDSSREAAKRFKQEARVLARLNHPNLLRVYDYGVHEGTPYLAIEYVAGADLGAFVKAHGIPPFDWTARVIATLAHTLGYCHELGVIHRDLKPANVLIETATRRPVLVDFGLIKRDPHLLHLASLDQQSLVSQTASVKGTPEYISPEQVNPKEFGEVGPRTDVYGLGATLYHLLTGQPPFKGRAAVVVMRKVTRKPPADPRELNPAVPPALAEVCMGCLEKRAEDRPTSAADLAEQLAQAAGISVPSPEVGVDASLSASSSGAYRLAQSDAHTVAAESGRYSLPTKLPAPGAQLAGCVIERELARGGGGAVYVARAPDGTLRAIKVLLGDMNKEDKQERFFREAEVGRELKHPGIVRVDGHGVENGLAYLVMEFLDDARTLDAYCSEERVSVAGKVQLMEQVAEAVKAAHEVGLIHRDLKPDNVLVTGEGQVKVVDFGIAKHVDKERLTMSGAVLGTLHYMSPEQIMGEGAHADARTDVYAMGVMLYQLVRGELPFTGGTGIEVMASIMADTPPDPCKGVDGAPPGLSAVIRMAMAREAKDRYASAVTFGRDLVASSSGSGRVSAVEVARSRSRRRGGVWALAATACLLVVSALGLLLTRRARQLGDEELGARLSAVHKGAWEVLSGPTRAPLASDGERVVALRVELDALLARRPDAVTAEKTQRVRRRVLALEGLHAVTAGDGAAVTAALAALEGVETPSADALRGAVGATEGDPGEAAKLLSRVVTRGVDRPELHALRVRARVREGITKAHAEEILADVNLLRRLRKGTSSPEELEALAWVRLALGSVDEAESILAKLETPPVDLRWAVPLARMTDVLEQDPGAALALVAGLPAPETVLPQAAVLAARVAGLASKLVEREILVVDVERPERCEMMRLARLLRLRARLAPGTPIDRVLIDGTLKHATGLYAAKGEAAARAAGMALAALCPDDVKVQTRVGRLGLLVYSAGAKLEVLPAMRRAVELEADRDARLGLEVEIVRMLADIIREEPSYVEECLSEASRVEGHVDGNPVLLGWCRASRGWAKFYAGDLEGALAEMDLAFEVHDSESIFVYRRARILDALGVRLDQCAADACEFALSQSTGSVRGEEMTAIVWDRLWPKGDRERVREVVGHMVRVRPRLPGWWCRLASLQLEVGERDEAAQSLREAAKWFGLGPAQGYDPRSKFDQRCQALAEAVAKKAGDAAERLTALVDDLERLRANNPDKRHP